MDPRRGVCIGCCRTLAEIASWGSMAEGERERILAELPERRQRLDIREAPMPPLA